MPQEEKQGLTISHLVPCCEFCGGLEVMIRGRYPSQPKRKVCPTCLQERLERIYEQSSPNYLKSYASKD